MKDMQVSSKVKGTGKYARQAKDEPETISDMEDADNDQTDDEVDSEEGDQDEEDAINEAFEESLKAKYEAALQDGSGAAATVKAAPAANYIRQSQQ